MDRKKLLLALALIASVALIWWALWWVFFRAPAGAPEAPPAPPAPPVNALPPAPPGGAVPPVQPGGITPPGAALPGAPAITPAIPTVAQGGRTQVQPITATVARFVRIAPTGALRYYNPSDQRFYGITPGGTPQKLSDRQFPAVRKATWSSDTAKAILEFPDGANVVYNFTSDEQVTLPKHWEQFSFAPDGERIAALAITLDRENRYLFAADDDGNNFRAIEPLGTNADKVDVAWSPNNQVVAFSRTGNAIGDGRQQILAIGFHGENFPGLVVEGIDFRPQWSPDGQRILYSAVHHTNDYKPELWIVDGVGDRIGANRRRLRVDTWADKCAFAGSETLYCAVPQGLERGYGLQPDIADDLPDVIERIDLRTGARQTIGRPERDTSIAALTVAPDGGQLYYTSRNDGRVYEMRLR